MAFRTCHQPRTGRFHRGGPDRELGRTWPCLVVVCVLRAAAALIWAGFASSPHGMLGLAYLAWLMSCLLILTSIILASVFVGGVLVKVFGITARNFHMAVLAGIIGALCRFLVGCWIARRAPDRALSAWLVVLISPGGGSRQIRRSPSFSAVGAVSGLAGKQLGSCIVLICKQV